MENKDIFKELGLDESVLKDDRKFIEILKEMQKERILYIRFLEKKDGEYFKEFSKEAELFLKLNEKANFTEDDKDLLLSKLKEIENIRKKKIRNIQINDK
ncbi:MAG: hypothetical protein KatS3mg068_1538 [Candidatus Sericytochromatia bacterium]|nr:MAG: hypothetical protein KatS3mg068_1538 [Candidatus Sericytochromatia bacterium]